MQHKSSKNNSHPDSIKSSYESIRKKDEQPNRKILPAPGLGRVGKEQVCQVGQPKEAEEKSEEEADGDSRSMKGVS